MREDCSIAEVETPIQSIGTCDGLEDIKKEQDGMWVEISEGNLVSIRNVKSKIEPGYYDVGNTTMLNRQSAVFDRLTVKKENLIKFEDTASVEILDEINKFWSMEKTFKKFGMPFKRGVLLYGPPGSGKTCLLKLLILDVIERGGVCLRMSNSHYIVLGLRDIRASQPDIPIVVVMEDLDEILENGNQSHILNMLDGVESTHKVLFLATTNYPAKLQKRISDRPSRFDRKVRIPNPDKRCRKIYFEHLFNGNLSDSGADIDMWVRDTQNMSLAHLKEIFVSVQILGNKYEEVIGNLKNMKKKDKSDDDEDKMGF